MSKTLENIEIGVRRYAGDDTISLSTNPGLHIVNSVYRDLATQLQWPEFRVTRNLYSGSANLVTIAAQESYEWAFEASALFADVRGVEVETTAASNEYRLLFPPESELAWNLAGQSTGMPKFYMRWNDSGTNKVALRPIPTATEAGGDIRVIGFIEPTALTSLSSVTSFLLAAADDALERVTASIFQVKAGNNEGAGYNIQSATSILQRLHDREKVTKEMVGAMVGVKQ